MKHQFIADKNGKKIAAVFSMTDYKKIVEKLEMLADIESYDKVLMASEPRIPYGKAIKQIEEKRKRKK